jgi:hypothetical protein
MSKLTEKQRRALVFLSEHGPSTPSAIGYAVSDKPPPGTPGRPLKAQGAGFIGGTMAWRLMNAGLVSMAKNGAKCGPRYEITRAGRAALTAAIATL